MWTFLRVNCRELENASRKDGDHQQKAALTTLTQPGASRAEALRELKTRSAQPRTWVGPTEAKQVFFDLEKEWSFTQTWKAKRALGKAWAWTMPKQSCLKSQAKTPEVLEKTEKNDFTLMKKSQTRTTTILGKNQKNDHRLPKKGTQKKALRQEEGGPTSWMQRTSAPAEEDPNRR